jgi:uncharacterized YigZ family protein
LIPVDTYKTIEETVQGEIFKDRGSKFIGYTFPVTSEDQIKKSILHLKELHHKARHWCYAWRLGEEVITFRVNDDGEPNNSAGNPILGKILSQDLTNILIVVVRYFGGTKLGVGGLINAYRIAAGNSIMASKIIQRTIDENFELRFEYADMNKIMRLIKENNLKILRQEMNMKCIFEISVRKNNAQKILKNVEELRCVKIKKLN